MPTLGPCFCAPFFVADISLGSGSTGVTPEPQAHSRERGLVLAMQILGVGNPGRLAVASQAATPKYPVWVTG